MERSPSPSEAGSLVTMLGRKVLVLGGIALIGVAVTILLKLTGADEVLGVRGDRDHARRVGRARRRGHRPAGRPLRARGNRRPPVGAGQPARAVHLAVRAPAGAGRPGSDRAHRLDPGQQPARPGPRVPRRRSAQRSPAIRRRTGPNDRGGPGPRGRVARHPDDLDRARRTRPGTRGRDLGVRLDRAADRVHRLDPVLAGRRPGGVTARRGDEPRLAADVDPRAARRLRRRGSARVRLVRRGVAAGDGDRSGCRRRSWA